jgi:hypothetical protein
MMELTASTLTTFYEDFFVATVDSYSGVAGETEGKVYVTASMWENCDSAEACIDGKAREIHAEPAHKIPLRVVYNDRGLNNGNADPISRYGSRDTESTTTAKLFFPDRNLVDDTTYFITLEFSVEVDVAAYSCLDEDGESRFVSTYFGAELGPYIIDAEIVKNGDFGECGWLAPEIDGCGLFDKIGGRADPDCGGKV